MYALVILAFLGIFVMIADMLRLKGLIVSVLVLGIAAAIGATCMEWSAPKGLFPHMIETKTLNLSFVLIILVLGMSWLLSSSKAIAQMPHSTEMYALTIFAMAGAVVMVTYANLSMLFLGIEILSVPMYVLAGSNKKSLASNEASVKYFITGAFSTGFFLFGLALIYGSTGSFSTSIIAEKIAAMQGSYPAMLITGILFVLSSMAFKIAAFPFHFWAADVYEGSPAAVTAYMATLVKAAAIGAFYLLFRNTFHLLATNWAATCALIAGFSILAGNIIAVYQKNFSRMLAYSGIAHAGYMLIALVSLNSISDSSIVYYVLSYGIATLSAFAVAQLVLDTNPGIDGLHGLWNRNKLLAVCLTVAMLSLAGIPPAAGFFAKYYLFTAAIHAGYIKLIFVAIAGTLVSVYFYFRVIHSAILSTSDNTSKIELNLVQQLLFVLLTAATLFLGLFPDFILQLIINN